MKQKKIKLIVMLALALCINGIPKVAFASQIINSQETKLIEQDKTLNKSKTLVVDKSSKSDKTLEESKSLKINKNLDENKILNKDDFFDKDETKERNKTLTEDNWLNREVAKQLNLEVRDLDEKDFLAIKKIDLSDERINEEIPSSISFLKNLEYLNLSSCKIEGKIDDSIAKLEKLKYLNLADNKIDELDKEFESKIINGKYEYCNLEENKITFKEGWHYLKGKWYYYDKNGDTLKGSHVIDGQKYEFTEEGLTLTGWYKRNDSWYYYDSIKGMLKNTWKDLSGKWYYFNSDGIMQKGIQNINGVKYHFNNSGVMSIGWQLENNKWYYLSQSGAMENGWKKLNGKWYYLDKNTGVMLSNEEKFIDGKNYKFYSDGTLAENVWLDNYKYSQYNGECVNTYNNYSHSYNNYNLFKYMTNTDNQVSVHNRAISLHGGEESNNCVYFQSELLRRNGFSIPTYTANVGQLERQLQSMGFVACYDLNQLKPGDILFTRNDSHVYLFMCWADGWNAYIADNQKNKFGNSVVHKRNVKDFDPYYDTDPATRFYYYPY
ncbi:hypothetical protein UT300005_15170 [Clostridium sp. CTA-5]